jgi:CBS domain-containing protein
LPAASVLSSGSTDEAARGQRLSGDLIGTGVWMTSVRDIMTTTVRKMHRDTIVREAEGIFAAHKISGAPLIDDLGHLVGFISKSDITRFDSTGDDPNYARVYEMANPNVITIGPTAEVEEAAQLMLREHVHHLIVMDGEAIVGVLSAFDFVRILAKNPTDE